MSQEGGCTFHPREAKPRPAGSPRETMTTAVKIHRQDQEKKAGVAVCGRKAAPGRITDDPDAVTCVVCRTFAADAREAIKAPHHPSPRGKTVVDRLVDPGAGIVDLTVRDVAKTRAMEKLASRHRDEYRTLFREELAAAKLLEELDLLDP